MTGWRWWGLLLVVLAAAAGCGDSNRPVKVAGKVTLDGEPVEGAVVNFVPENGIGRPAIAWTRADGSFDLTTYSSDDGALRGSYKVLVGKTDQTRSANAEGTPGAEATAGPRPKSLLPAIYNDLSRTPFHCTIPTDGPVMLELRSDG